LAKAVFGAAGGRPFVLLGYSSGGILAHALAEWIEGEGAATAAGVLLLDTYRHDREPAWPLTALALAQLLDRDHEFLVVEDRHLLALAVYLDLFADWTAREVKASSLLVQADRPLPGGIPAGPPLADRSTLVVADHFSVLADDCELAAGAVSAWLQGILIGETL